MPASAWCWRWVGDGPEQPGSAKQSAQGYAPETGTLLLDDARQLLRARTVRGLQIRYRHDGADWWDTLMVVGQNFRLVRIRHEFA